MLRCGMVSIVLSHPLQALLYDFRRETDGTDAMLTSAALDAALGACGRAGKADEALVRSYMQHHTA
jgi:hypothetical protein